MNEDAFMAQLIAYGHTPQTIARAIHVAPSSSDLIGSEYNIVNQGGRFEVLQPDGRAGFALALVRLGEPFAGETIEDAYEFIIEDIQKRRRRAGLPV
ncbi:hypothetical protein [Microbacterium sp. SA39]|uniref:hypothetical protein n=1 Tax=Microbacterium sp. SA39 TaxID=1263625 RepID=UPI0005FA56CD|nr:hypothetical protein [Microbacterium sp. SA39]KJQ55988.1 hypothetical protein RS85_00192 [Microbacterium sp. SA39]